MRRVKWFWAAAVLGLAADGCSLSGEPETPPDTVKPPTAAAFVTVAFETASGQGTITVSGNSPVAEWFASQPGEVSLDLPDADIDDPPPLWSKKQSASGSSKTKTAELFRLPF